MASQLSTPRLSDQAYAELKRLIVSSELAPGTLLTERDLMTQVGFGRTPLREALQRLEREHFVSVVPGGGHLVTSMTPADMRSIYELRLPIECLSARLAAVRARPRDVLGLREFVAESEAALPVEDGAWHLAVDGRFHDLVAAASGNQYMRATLANMFSLTERILYACRPIVPPVDEDLPFYGELTDLIEAHDASGAERLMLDHITGAASSNWIPLDR